MSAASSWVVAVLVGGLLTLTLPASPAAAALPAEEPDNTGMVNGKVRSIVQAGGRIWVGGAFTQMLDANGNTVRAVNNLAAFNASTGAPDLGVSIPSVTRTTGSIVYDMSLAPDGKVYIAGAFDKVNGQTRKNVAAFDPNTGALASFSANPANATAVLATSDAVYVGTSKLVKYTLSGAAAPGYGPPQVNIDPAIRGHSIPSQFRDIVNIGSTLVAACQCDSLDDGSGFVDVKSLVKIDANSGDLLNWQPAGLGPTSAAFGISAFVRDFPSASDRTVFLASGGSDFTAAYDYESGSQRWKTDTSGSSQVVTWHQNTLIVGGHFQWVPKTNNQQCDDNQNPNTQCWHAPRLVAMDPSDGDVILEGGSPWNPGICCKYNGVWALLVDQDGGKLHVGGEFTKVGGSWSGAGTSWNLNGAQNQDYYARLFAPVSGSQTLTVANAGAGSGTVTSDPSGINCGTTCSASYGIGASVTLTAAAAAGSTFAGWTGDCTGAGSTCTVTMSASRTVTATFAPVTHAVTVTKAGAGAGTVTSTPVGISCGNTCSSATAGFPEGTVVTLSATSGGSNVFTGWSGAGCSGTGTCQVTMTAAATVQAAFEPPRSLTVTKSGAGSGTVTSSPPRIDCGSTCNDSFAQGSTVTLTATAAADSIFTGWSGDCSGTTCTVTMDTGRVVNANFELKTPVLTVAVAGQGTGSITSDVGSIDCPDVDCDDTFTQPTVVTLTATADPGSSFAGFTGGGCSGSDETCQVTMDQARSVTASFSVPSACGRIVFSSNRSGNPDVWVMGGDGSGQTNLTNRSGSDTEPAWSPDCSKIAFSSTRSGNVDIYVMNADGSGTQRLTTHAAADTEPSWSPDGSSIAFVSARTGNAEIFTMNADGGNQLNRSNNSAIDTSPDWSPDGSTIAFDSTRGGGLNIWAITPAGGSPTRITTGLGRAQAPAWSPSGTKIALASDSSGKYQIWTVAANGSGASRLTNDAGVHSHPSWSPDGAKLAYANTVIGGKNQIWVVNQNGTGAVNTSVSTKLDTLPGWSA